MMFFRKMGLKYGSHFVIIPKINLLDDTFPMGYHSPKTEIVAKVMTLGS